MPSDNGDNSPWYRRLKDPNAPPPTCLQEVRRIHHHQIDGSIRDAVEAGVAVLVPDMGFHSGIPPYRRERDGQHHGLHYQQDRQDQDDLAVPLGIGYQERVAPYPDAPCGGLGGDVLMAVVRYRALAMGISHIRSEADVVLLVDEDHAVPQCGHDGCSEDRHVLAVARSEAQGLPWHLPAVVGEESLGVAFVIDAVMDPFRDGFEDLDARGAVGDLRCELAHGGVAPVHEGMRRGWDPPP